MRWILEIVKQTGVLLNNLPVDTVDKLFQSIKTTRSFQLPTIVSFAILYLQRLWTGEHKSTSCSNEPNEELLE